MSMIHKQCGTEMMAFESSHETEGIRPDYWCPKCDMWFACHKWGFRALTAAEVKQVEQWLWDGDLSSWDYAVGREG